MKDLFKSLRFWFITHFVVDMFFAVPLMIFPVRFLQLMGVHTLDPIPGRIIAAALVAVSVSPLLAKKMHNDCYCNFLISKTIWAGLSMFGLLISLFSSFNIFALLVFMIFTSFFSLWIYFSVRLKKNPK